MCSYDEITDDVAARTTAPNKTPTRDSILARSRTLKRLKVSGQYLSTRKKVESTTSNKSFFDTTFKPRTLFSQRQALGAALYFWGHRVDCFSQTIPEASLAHFSKWRIANLNARHEKNAMVVEQRRPESNAVLRRIIECLGECPRLLAELANHEDVDVRVAVAENGHSTLNTLFALAGDSNPDVRLAMAENHNAPIAILQFLADDSNPYVTARAQRTLSRLIQTDVNTSLLDRLSHVRTKRRARA